MLKTIDSRATRVWVIVLAVLTLGTMLCSVIAAFILDVLIKRPVTNGGSVNTLIPGLTYAIATVMKVCLLVGLILVLVLVLKWVLTTFLTKSKNGAAGSSGKFPVWGLASASIPPVTPLFGSLAVVIAQRLVAVVGGGSMNFTRFSQIAVVISLVFISGGVLAALLSLKKQELPRLVPVLGLITNLLLIGLFWHFEFYALGFDQDTWAPR